VAFRRVPVFSEPLQRAYYALEAMGQLEAAHDKLFALFFTDSVRPAGNKPEAVADWAAKAGVDRARFLEAYQSFGVAGKVRRATQLADLYQVEGTPAVGVAGRFLVPGQAERTLPIVNALIAEARKS
jgi:thiol:disulfide interchange protein DsbA